MGELDEPVVVFFDPEDFAFVVAGKGRGVEDDAVEAAALAGKAFEPVEGVTFTEIVVGGVELVEAEIVPGPVEVNLGEIQGGGGGSAERGADGEGSGVGEGVEHGFGLTVASGGRLANPLAVEALVEKDPLGVTGLKVDLVTDAGLGGGECFVLFRSSDVARTFFLVLVETFPIGAVVLSCEPLANVVG